METWKESMSNNVTFFALIDNKIGGFSDMIHKGHLDKLYFHKDYLSQGIASSLIRTKLVNFEMFQRL